MNAPQDHDAQLLKAGGPAAVIIRSKEKILARFCERARQSLQGARGELTPVLIDTLPLFITRVALALAGGEHLQFASQFSNIGLQHGNERARFTSYSLSEVLKEYQFLREILMDVLGAEARLDAAQWRIVHRSMDEAMAEAAISFVTVHDEFREMFTATLTHDFRGPLSNAWNYLELVRRESRPAERDHYAARAGQNLQRISRMVNSLLDVSRSNAGERMAVTLSEFELRPLLEEAIGDLDAHHRQNLALDSPIPLKVCWDREMIRRAIDNLVDNAFKYSAPDSRVTIRTVETQGRTHLSVHNIGEPISPEDQATLFRPFGRTAAAERSGKSGWGLGLAQVQRIAEAHGGVVGVESSDSGTTFTLDLVTDVRKLNGDEAGKSAHR